MSDTQRRSDGRVDRTCEKCGKAFVVNYKNRVARFCSQDCLYASRSATGVRRPTIRDGARVAYLNCEQCKREFPVLYKNRKGRKLCSRECANAKKRKHAPIVRGYNWIDIESFGDSMKPAAGFPGYYVTADGRVWTSIQKTWRGYEHLPRVRELRPILNLHMGNGYYFLNLRSEGKTKLALVHRVVLESFIGPPPDGMECCHCNGISTDNRLENLRWDTHKNNIREAAFVHCVMQRGSQKCNAKLTEGMIPEIRAASRGGESGESIAKRYGVSGTTIRDAVRRRTWRHVA